MEDKEREEKKQQVIQKELNEEQREYLLSFKEAMRAIDERIKKDSKGDTRKMPKAYRELVRDGYWSPDIIAFEFALCTRNLCGLSRRLREYIYQVGLVAKEIHDKMQENKEEKKDEDNN